MRLLGHPVKLSRHARPTPTRPAPALGEHTEEVLGEAGLDDDEIAELLATGAAAGPSAAARAGEVPRMSAQSAAASAGEELLKISELAERADVPVATVRHYLREGLLPEPVKTSRNMAYYPPEFVERIRLIKQLQEERFMPLRVIRDLLDDDRRRPRAAAGDDRARGPDPRPGPGGRARARPRGGGRAGATTSRARCSTGSPSSAC